VGSDTSLSILRSAVTTRLDGFTIDEAYHIAAGVSYVKYHDFRINPEHPPLVKLWVGSVMAATGFRLDALHQFNDKPGERDFRAPIGIRARGCCFPTTVSGGNKGREETGTRGQTERSPVLTFAQLSQFLSSQAKLRS
jgi:hypothetical protein